MTAVGPPDCLTIAFSSCVYSPFLTLPLFYNRNRGFATPAFRDRARLDKFSHSQPYLFFENSIIEIERKRLEEDDGMQYGHFDNEKREYVIDRVDLPTSWTNYLG